MPSLPRTSTGDIKIGDIRSHVPEISKKIATEMHEAIEEIRLEIISQVKKEMTTSIKKLLSIAREDIDNKSRGVWENDRNLNEQYRKEIDCMK